MSAQLRRGSHLRGPVTDDPGAGPEDDERVPGLQEEHLQAGAHEDHSLRQEAVAGGASSRAKATQAAC